MLGLEPTQEEQLLKESAERFIEREYPLAERRRAARSTRGYREEVWEKLASLGWLGLTLPESAGGYGGGARENAILMEAFGRGLVVEPYLATVVLAAGAIATAAPQEAGKRLEGVAEGKRKLSLAYVEPGSRYDLNAVATRAEASASGFRLSGRKSIVLNADTADGLVVSARTSGGELDREGISLLAVPVDADGVSLRAYPTNDGGRAAEVELDGVEVGGDAVIGELGGALPVLERTVDQAIAALAAEALGVMSVLNKLTLEYSKTREQFGQPIGRNQAIQHRLVDMFVALEETRSLVSVYLDDVDSDAPVERARAASALKIQTAKAGRLIGQEAIQLHGGIAMTEEYAAGHYFKRLTVLGHLFGDLDWHLDRFADLS